MKNYLNAHDLLLSFPVNLKSHDLIFEILFARSNHWLFQGKKKLDSLELSGM